MKFHLIFHKLLLQMSLDLFLKQDETLTFLYVNINIAISLTSDVMLYLERNWSLNERYIFVMFA